jgi:hypothetical protein
VLSRRGHRDQSMGDSKTGSPLLPLALGGTKGGDGRRLRAHEGARFVAQATSLPRPMVLIARDSRCSCGQREEACATRVTSLCHSSAIFDTARAKRTSALASVSGR